MAPANPIRAYRLAKDMTLDALATEIGVRRNTIWRWENGRIPDRKQWSAIVKATGIPREQLIRYAMEAA
jgi:transcriptional regulator with XRE-family HTH domain